MSRPHVVGVINLQRCSDIECKRMAVLCAKMVTQQRSSVGWCKQRQRRELIVKCIASEMHRLRSFLTSAPKCISNYAFDGHSSLLYRLTTNINHTIKNPLFHYTSV
jgi:hypothetical protein